MKIAILMFQVFNDLGGILPSTKNLCHGLVEAGHEPFIVHAEWKEQIHGMEQRIERTTSSGFGLRYWISGNRARLVANEKHSFPYKGKTKANELREILSEFDGVILATSIPSYRAKAMKDNNDWKTVLKHGKPMIAIVRDCHWISLSPHILPLRHRFLAMSGVHPAAYYSLKNFPGRIACQVNPFDISGAIIPPEKDWNAICVTSWFKKWKRMEDLIRASPFMKPVHLHCAGGGEELSYMLAKIKPKKEYTGKNWEAYVRKIMYYRWKKGDQDYLSMYDDVSIFRAAEDEGNFHYHGFLLGEKLKELHKKCGGLADFSYHYGWGEHFNRVIIEAMVTHSIPFVRPFGISDNEEGKGKIFGPDNVVLVPEDSSPKQTGEIIRSSMRDKVLRKQIISNNLEKLKMFDRKQVAKNYIRMLQGKKDVGLFGITEGMPDLKCRKYLKEFNAIRRFSR